MHVSTLPVRTASSHERRCVGLVLLALLGISLLTSFPAAAQVPQVAVTGVVFADLDGDGEQDPEEPGLGGVTLSNGVDVFTSADNGTFSCTVTRDVSRFVLLTVPRGYRATRGFYHRVGDAAVDSTAFGLVADPASDSDRFCFVHASDAHVYDGVTAAEFSAALAEISSLASDPAFAVITGDLVNAGTPVQLGHVAGVLAAPPLAVHAGFGDHDADSDSLLVRTFESLIGPTCYSFDRGPYHFILYNDVFSTSLDGSFPQRLWLENDIAAATGQEILIFTHYQPDRREIDDYRSLGVDAVFSGHWHANRSTTVDGIISLNTGTLRMAGIDRTSRGFRVVTLDAGMVSAERRTGGIAPRMTLVDPASGLNPLGPIPIRAMGYATDGSDLSARFTATGPGGVVASGDLTHDGGWSYTATWDGAAAGPGAYRLEVELSGPGGVLATSEREIILEHVERPDGAAGAPFAQFRGDMGGSGRVGGALELPLHVAWSRNLGGPSELASPVTADGRVFMAHGAATDPGTPGLVALDLLSGAELWRHPTLAEVKGAPAVAGGRVFLITTTGTVEALDAASGGLQWTAQLGDPADRFDVTSPLVADGVVYVGGPAVTAALDAATGTLLWERRLGADWVATIHSAPAADAAHVALGLHSGLFVLDRASGNTLWSRAANERETHRSPALVDGVLYAAGDNFGSHRLRAFDVPSGAELWSAPYGVGNSNSAPAVGDSVVVIGSGFASVEAFSRADGRSVWSFAVGSPIASARPYSSAISTVTSSPIIAGNEVYFGADDGRLYAVDVNSGVLRWSADLGAPIRSSPAASGNMLLIATADGTLFALVAGETTAAGIGQGPEGAPALRAAIGPASPNPFHAAGTIPITIAAGGPGAEGGAVPAQLDIIDVQGRRVRTLVAGSLAPGRHALRWDGRDASGQEVASGVYFLRLAAGRDVVTSRLTLVR